ncbi:MAG: hypothetical protein QOE82_1434 [Thermoanaerobaculia bacterium]|jgi:hypothetical protein|nr:hypothetical protein [Thermoanaerobaculia bacterium]
MEPHDLLPKRVANYIHDIGVRSLDHLAEHFEAPAPPATPEGENATAPLPANAIQTLVQHWKEMAPEDKEHFVERVSASVMEVIVASATLPLGLKVGKKTVKVAKKAIRKQVKKVRKAAKPPKPPKAAKKDEGKKKKKKP